MGIDTERQKVADLLNAAAQALLGTTGIVDLVGAYFGQGFLQMNVLQPKRLQQRLLGDGQTVQGGFA